MARTKAEIGSVGLPIWSGRLSLDPNVRLRGRQAMQIYRQMLMDEPACAALRTAILTLFRTDIQVQPGGETSADEAAAQFVEECLGDMRDSLPTTLRQMAGMIFYGFGIHELVYKRRNGGNGSKYDDGRVGWAAWALRRQASLERWETDASGRVIGFTQRPEPDFLLRTIPLTKCIHLIADDSEASPEGVSWLRGMYRYWYMVTQFELLFGIALERFGTGMPVFSRVESGTPVQLTTAQENTLAAIAEGVRQNEFAYVLEPPGIKFRFEPSPGLDAAVYLETIQRYRVWMLSTALAEFVALGTGDTGSFALGKSKIDLFLRALTGFQTRLTDAINRQAIPRLFRYNDFGTLTDYPTVTLPAVREYDLPGLSTFAKTLHDIGAFHVTPEDEQLFRNISDLADIDMETLESAFAQDAAHAAPGAGMVPCPNCGMLNPMGADHCAMCGAEMPMVDAAQRVRPTGGGTVETADDATTPEEEVVADEELVSSNGRGPY